MKKNIMIITLFSFLLFVAVVGCGVNGRTTTPNYFPHEDGYSWEYRITMTLGTNETTSTRWETIDGTTTLSDGTVVQNMVVSDEGFSRIDYFLVNDSGVYSYGTSNYPTTEASLILPFPLEAGQTWQIDDGISYKAFGIESVTVPAGAFSAFKIGLINEAGEETGWYSWFADGTGRVKSSTIIYFPVFEDERIIVAEGTAVQELVGTNF